VFIDNNITFRIMNRPQNKTVKGPAYHWDTLVTGLLIGVSSAFGLPWMVRSCIEG
jgi:hypothetical protein